MATTKEQISKWFDNAKSVGSDFLFVVHDTYDCEDYPVVAKCQEFAEKYDTYNGKNMQIIEEIYDLSMDKEMQLNEHRAFHYPDGRKTWQR